MMTKKVLTWAIVLALMVNVIVPQFIYGATTESEQTVVFSSDFEDGIGEWEKFGNPTLEVVQDNKHTGESSLKVSNRTSGYYSPSINLTEYVDEGQKYTISLWAYHQGTEAADIKITHKNNDQYHAVASKSVQPNVWTEIKADYTMPLLAKDFNFYVESTDETLSFYIDDVTIVGPPKGSTDPFVPGEDGVGEPITTDFEDGTSQGWIGRGDGQVTVVSDKVHGGSKSIHVTDRTSTWNGAQIDVTKNIANGIKYPFGVWVYQESGQSKKIILSLEVVTDEGTNYINVANGNVPSHQWTFIENSSYAFVYGGELSKASAYVESSDSTLSYYIDDFSIGEGIAPKEFKIEEDIPDLYSFYDFPIGTAISTNSLTGERAKLLKKHFNSITAGNDMKPDTVQPQEGTFNFIKSDKYVEFAKENNMGVRGHTLVWHSQTPDWVFKDENGNSATKEVLLQRMENHISTVVGRYKDSKNNKGEKIVYAWDVVNEAIDISTNDMYRHSNWYNIFGGPEYIEKAFYLAREADPDAKLFYNDYNIVSDAKKRQAVYNMVKTMREKGVPIDGVGLQCHIRMNYPSVQDIEKTVKMFTDLGVDVQITELDITIYNNYQDKYEEAPQDIMTKQGERYKAIMEAVKQYANQPSPKGSFTGFTVWGLTDDESWLRTFNVTRNDWPLLFDETGKAKPAYWGLVNNTLKYGDVNNDDVVNSLDYALLKAYLLSKIDSLENPDAADLDESGQKDSMDLIIFQQYILEAIDTLPYHYN